MTEPSGAHLTISRINRLLRPLRNKCNSLAALSKTTGTSRATYSKQLSNLDPDSYPPLATLLCPSAGTKKLMLDSRSAEEFELSRRIHAVCDAFRNIAHVAYRQSCTEHIPSLAAMCALVVGANITAENLDNTLVDSDGDPTDRKNMLDTDTIYEAVPSHYRRYLIVSHALSMTLCICYHHHTLVTILLDHCLSFGLVHESTHLLNIILAQAFWSSNSSCPPPATHPAHTNYLFDLHAKWTTGNKPPGTPLGSLLFTTSTFCQAVVGILSQTPSCTSHILWTSKVLSRLLHAVKNCDIDSYIAIIHALSRSLRETSDGEPYAIRDDTRVVMLKDKLSELMSILFDLLFTQHDSHSSPPTSSRIYAAIDILHDCYAAQLHRLRTSTQGLPIDLPDMIISFTTHIFVAFRNSIDNSDLIAILDDSSPVPTTFSKLMVHFWGLQKSQEFEDSVEAFLAELRVYSSAFHSEKLLGLDASLWACALHHFETCIASSQKGSSNSLVARYKRQLMEAVDAAERRCFGGDTDNSPIVSLPTGRARRTQRGRLSGHWEWEDMVGSWIRKTPVHKKRKIDDGHPHTSSRHSHSRLQDTITPKAVTDPTSFSTLSSTHHRRSSTFSSSPSCSWPSELESHTEDGSEYQEESDKENTPINHSPAVKETHPIKRRSSNFFSLLADAQSNRIILHSQRRLKLESPPFVIPEKNMLPLSSQESRRATPRKQEKRAIPRKVTPPPAPSGALLPSDDLLDLFAYATSSPARC